MTKSPGRVHLDEIQYVLPAEILHAKFIVSSVALAGWRDWILHRDFLSSCGDADVCGLPMHDDPKVGVSYGVGSLAKSRHDELVRRWAASGRPPIPGSCEGADSRCRSAPLTRGVVSSSGCRSDARSASTSVSVMTHLHRQVLLGPGSQCVSSRRFGSCVELVCRG